MSELHDCNIIDDESPFIIDSATRAIKISDPGSNNLHPQIIVQGDKNVERFRFKAPRTIEGHDMSECDRIEIHYINVSSSGDQTSSDIYVVKDAVVVGNEIEFSWLVSSTATKYSGTLSFAVKFICGDTGAMAPSSEAEYVWNTRPFTAANVEEGYDNKPAVIDSYIDIIQEWYSRFDARINNKLDKMSFVDEGILNNPNATNVRPFDEGLYRAFMNTERAYVEKTSNDGGGLNTMYPFRANVERVYAPYGYNSKSEMCAQVYPNVDEDEITDLNGKHYITRTINGKTTYHPRLFTAVSRTRTGTIRASNPEQSDDVVNLQTLEQMLDNYEGESSLLALYVMCPNCSASDFYADNTLHRYKVEYFNRMPKTGEIFKAVVITQTDDLYSYLTAEITGFNTENGDNYATFKALELSTATGAKDYVAGGSLQAQFNSCMKTNIISTAGDYAQYPRVLFRAANGANGAAGAYSSIPVGIQQIVISKPDGSHVRVQSIPRFSANGELFGTVSDDSDNGTQILDQNNSVIGYSNAPLINKGYAKLLDSRVLAEAKAYVDEVLGDIASSLDSILGV